MLGLGGESSFDRRRQLEELGLARGLGLLAAGKRQQVADELYQVVDPVLGSAKQRQIGLQVFAHALVGGHLDDAAHRSEGGLELVDHGADEALLLHGQAAHLGDVGQGEDAAQSVAVLRAERDDAGHVVALADGQLADGAVFGRGGQGLHQGGERTRVQELAGRPAQHVLLFPVQECRHGLVGEHHISVLVDDEHGVAQRRDEGVGLRLLLRESEEACFVLLAQPLLLGPGLLALDQRLDHAQQIVGHERLGQEEVDPLEGGRARQVDVGIGRDHAGHEMRVACSYLLVEGQAVGVGEAVVEQGDVVVVGGEERESLLAGAGVLHFVAFQLEDLADGRAHAVLVVDYQDASRGCAVGHGWGCGPRRGAGAGHSHDSSSSAIVRSCLPVAGLSTNRSSLDQASSPCPSWSKRSPVSLATPLNITMGVSAKPSRLRSS